MFLSLLIVMVLAIAFFITIFVAFAINKMSSAMEDAHEEETPHPPRKVMEGSRARIGGKIPSLTNQASRQIASAERELREADVEHESADCKYYAADPSFSFNGKRTVDDFAELRRRNRIHERHLEERIQRE